MDMTEKVHPIELDDERLAEAAGGADATQRSRVTSLTVTFTAQTTFGPGDPDKPVIIGNVPNADR